jgi:hypothetical protein
MPKDETRTAREAPVPGATGYKVFRTVTAGKDQQEIASTTTPQHLDSAVEPTIGPYEVYEDEWFNRPMERSMYTTFLASAFRSIRFGINEAHGRGIAIQLNYMLDHGAFCDDPNPRNATGLSLDGNVGDYGGSVAQVARPAGSIAVCIDLVRLHSLK